MLSSCYEGVMDMIEVIYKEEKKEATGNEEFFRVPRNIRQIGEIKGNHKIYMEDYVDTFLERLSKDGKKEGKTAILMGRINWQEGISYTFIRGAILVENLDAAPEKVAFTDEIWTQIEEKQKKYFSNQDVVGWFYTMPDLPMEVSDSFYRAHLNYFGGNDKVFFLKDPSEQEEAFFLYDNGHMNRQSGYYIYYEKNPQMQDYMIFVNGQENGKDEDAVEDQAVVSFRKIIAEKREKQEGEEQEKKSPLFMYAASACLTLTVLAVGVNFINNYQKMQNVTENVQQVAGIGKNLEQESVKSDSKSVQNQPTEEEKQVPAADITVKASDSDAIGKENLQKKTQEEKVDLANQSENEIENSELQEEDQKIQDQEESPTPTPNTEEEPTESAGTQVHESYTIQFGDSLYKISTSKYGTMDMIPEICKLNGISTNDIIYPGQKILLP